MLGERWWYVRASTSRRSNCCSPRTRPISSGSTSAEPSPYVKDGINDFVVDGTDGSTPARQQAGRPCAGDRAAGRHVLGRSALLRRTLTKPFADFDATFASRIAEADTFYERSIPPRSATTSSSCRQAFAGLLWSKQYYHYDV